MIFGRNKLDRTFELGLASLALQQRLFQENLLSVLVSKQQLSGVEAAFILERTATSLRDAFHEDGAETWINLLAEPMEETAARLAIDQAKEE